MEKQQLEILHLSPLTGAASGMRFLLEKPQQLAAASGLLIAADADNLSDADIIVDFVTPTSKKDCCHALIKF